MLNPQVLELLDTIRTAGAGPVTATASPTHPTLLLLYKLIIEGNMAPTPPLIIAVKARNIAECRRLIETGEANANEKDRDGVGWTALHWLSMRGYIDIAELLVYSGV